MATWSSYHGYPVYQGDVISDVATSLVTGFDKREDARKKAEAEAAKLALQEQQKMRDIEVGQMDKNAEAGMATGYSGRIPWNLVQDANSRALRSAQKNEQEKRKTELDIIGKEIENKKAKSDAFDSGWKKANEALQGLAKTEKLLAVNDAITGGSQSAEFQQSMAQSVEYIAKETGVPKSVLTALQTGQKAEDVYTAYKLNEITDWDKEAQKCVEAKDYSGLVKVLAKKQDTIVKLAINGKMDPTIVKKMYDDAESFKKDTLKTMMSPEKVTPGQTKEQLIADKAAGKKLTPAQEGVYRDIIPQKPVEKPEKPEYTPKQALSRISTIDATIARLQSSGKFDTAMAIQNPQLAALLESKDPEAITQAIDSLKTERDYVSQFAPKGAIKPLKDSGTDKGGKPQIQTSYKTADEVRDAYRNKKITKEAAAKILQSNFGYK